MSIEELLNKAIFEAGNVDALEFPMHGQICQNYIKEAIVELESPTRNMSILEKAKLEVCIHYPGCPCCRRFMAVIDKAIVELERPVGNKSTELNKAKEVLSWCQENADEKWMVDHLALVDKHLEQAIAELQKPAGLTNIKLHRRCQAAESAVKENIDVCRRQGVSLGRKLANAGYLILEDETKAQAKRIEELEKENKQLKENQQAESTGFYIIFDVIAQASGIQIGKAQWWDVNKETKLKLLLSKIKALRYEHLSKP